MLFNGTAMVATRKRWQGCNFSALNLCVDSKMPPSPMSPVDGQLHSGLLTGLVGSGCKCLRGGLGRRGRYVCCGQGLEREDKTSAVPSAQPAGERPSQPSQEMPRAGREMGVRSALLRVAGGLLWKPNQHLGSALQAACLPLYQQESCPLSHPQVPSQLLTCRALAGLPQEPLQLLGESQCLFQSHIKMTKHHNAFSSSRFKHRELLSFHCN